MTNENQGPLSHNGKIAINNLANAAYDTYGDSGTCVMGMKLRYLGIQIANGIVQGSLTNEYFFKAVIEHFEKLGHDASDFKIDWGYMD